MELNKDIFKEKTGRKPRRVKIIYDGKEYMFDSVRDAAMYFKVKERIVYWWIATKDNIMYAD